MRVRPSVAAFVLTAALVVTGLTACSDPGTAPAPVTAASTQPQPTVSTSDTYTSCTKLVYASQKTATVAIPVGACVSFGRFGDIAAVITDVSVNEPSLFRELDALTYRGTVAGRSVFTIATKREICTATATCQVPNPPKHVTVVVRTD